MLILSVSPNHQAVHIATTGGINTMTERGMKLFPLFKPRSCRIWFSFANTIAILVMSLLPLWAQDASTPATITRTTRGVHLVTGSGNVDVEMLEGNVLRVDVQPDGKKSPRTPILEPDLVPGALRTISIHDENQSTVIWSAHIVVSISHAYPFTITVHDEAGNLLVEEVNPFGDAHNRSVVLHHEFGENLYGMRGLERRDNGGGLLRNNGAQVAAGAQGDAGAPWFFTPRYGVLIDSDGGEFFTQDGTVEFNNCSRSDTEYFVIQGNPLEVMARLSDLTGHPPMPPKWTLGFLNSQWGSSEAEVKQIVSTYRAKHIPIDGFILDYDWKAWGEDNYGEWRWNSTSSPENSAPDKFPDGASGIFAQEMRAQGIKLCGILKPRILVYKKGSTTVMHDAAAYADAHGFWYPGEPQLKDTPTVRDLDFSNPAARAWFWKHLEPAFDAGMIAWWNDEADHTYPNWPDSSDIYNFNNFQFFNMGRMLYEGQRKHSDLRVWSINRNYYLGAQRYGYAEWSGDIETGFESMQDQRMRMLATLDLGEPHWSMDTGGFFGHPSPENYARWMEFAAFTPIFRVHGEYMQKRQPWVYGPLAEAAATHAIQLRYELLPYIYSYERTASETGIGVVRPLFWMFPNDPHIANDGASWMFGDSLLISPVVSAGESVHRFYLPSGTWYDYARGTRLEGGQMIDDKVDTATWKDIPIFIRAGAIIPTQPSEDYIGERPSTDITLDVFPASQLSRFVYYDDDGATYSYERGAYYRQLITTSSVNGSVQLTFDKPTGTFQAPLRHYIVHLHGIAAKNVLLNEVPVAESAPTGDSWTSGQDRFGPLTTVTIEASRLNRLVLR
ncbi:MAG TPA: TIM-barrel domain-containing protein [Terracidiphilus sp.]|jgi:alpha-glucosidase|nr:TIM-barrel domain-containing protein [Terracidiphilus sp.]